MNQISFAYASETDYASRYTFSYKKLMFTNPVFLSKPDRAQLALGGKWETAHLFRPGELETETEVKHYLGENQEVAFEAFFGGAFFGFRQHGMPQKLIQLISNTAAALKTAKSGAEFFSEISRIANLRLGAKFISAEIGAVNVWASVGPFLIKDAVVAVASFDECIRELKISPVGLNTTHPKALEFIFQNDDDSTHWFAFPISNSKPPFEIDLEKLKAALNVLRVGGRNEV